MAEDKPTPSTPQWVLTKQSSSIVIYNYFMYVLEAKQSGEPFPCNLDDVWQLAYSTKGSAVRALRQDFIEGIDFKVFNTNVKNPQGGKPTEEYLLSTSCLEYFIARKVREVFDIYCQALDFIAKMAQQTTQPVPTAAPQRKKKAENKPTRPVSVAMLRSEYANIALMRDTCNLSPADVADMANKISEKHGLTARIKYVPANHIVKSATELLQKYRNGFSTQTFNKMMIKHGYLKEEPRPTSKGGTTTFKMLTDKAASYGENKRSPHNAREMQPLYYDDMFCELCDNIGVPNEVPQENLLPLDFGDNTAI